MEGSNVNDWDVSPGPLQKRPFGIRAAGLAVIATTVITALASAASAQTLPTNPVPQGSPVPRILPPRPPSVAPGPEVPELVPPSGEVPNRPVRVTSVEVERRHRLPAARDRTADQLASSGRRCRCRRSMQRARRSCSATAPTATCSPPSRPISTPTASAALRGHRRPHRQRQARWRHRPGRHAGAALPQPADRTAADRFGHAGALPAAGAGRARRQPARRAGAVNRHTRRAEPDRPGQPPAGLRPRHHRQPRLHRDRADRGSRRARPQQLHRVRREDRALLLPRLPEQPEFRPGLHRGVHWRVRPER